MLRIVPAQSREAISQARELFLEYASTPEVGLCLVDFEGEVATLPGAYAAPDGRLLLAIHEGVERLDGPVGCAGMRRLGPETCEMKRLYIRPAFRGKGAGRELVMSLIADARLIGYKRMVLDTLPSMQEAHILYRRLGFREIPSYQTNPIHGALFFELTLRQFYE